MKAVIGARVLVSTDNLDDSKQILQQLEAEFQHVRASTNLAMALRDFEEFRPDVLVLAFDTLDKAQRYYLGLYRLGQMLIPHRTVILCDKSEVRAVFDLCKKEYFSDYVLYWPQVHDGLRLAMSVWNAFRETRIQRSDTPRNPPLLKRACEGGAAELVDAEQQDRQQTAGVLETAEQAAHEAADSTNQAHQASDIDVDAFDIALRKLEDKWELGRASKNAPNRNFSTARPVVMIVDDDIVARTLIGRMLDPQTYEVRTACDAIEALSQLRQGRPDVVLMDVQMPGLDGLGAAQRMKRSKYLADIPVIMMTGDARREVLDSSIAAGAEGFMVKPVTRASLNVRLASVLRHREPLLPGA